MQTPFMRSWPPVPYAHFTLVSACHTSLRLTLIAEMSTAQVDRGKSGFLTPEAIHAFLADVGLEATPFDMRHIMAELDPEHTGIVSRSSFINFIRYGGQHAPPLKVDLPCLAHCIA